MAAIIKGNSRQTTSAQHVSEGAEVYLKMLRDGSIAFADFLLVAELEGLVKVASSGKAVTAVTCAGAYDADGEDFALVVPTGTTVMVIGVEVVVTSITDDEPVQVLFMVSNTAITGTTGTAVTVVNKMTDQPTGSACTCYVAMDAAGGTDVSGGSRAYAFFRSYQGMGTAVTANIEHQLIPSRYAWAAPKDGLPAIVVGAGSVAGHITKTTAASAHINVEWVEFPSSYLS